ncbi:hypothetical protein DFS34DRAFT_621314 [Phlyctochytrium arcticum]|nr:hypothetical protein DFS34DRAFT_621314 [Phlyctochytrium arcticum]
MNVVINEYFCAHDYLEWTIRGCLEQIVTKQPPGDAAKAIHAMQAYISSSIINNKSLKKYAANKGQTLHKCLCTEDMLASFQTLLRAIDANEEKRLLDLATAAEAACNNAGFQLVAEQGIRQALGSRTAHAANIVTGPRVESETEEVLLEVPPEPKDGCGLAKAVQAIEQAHAGMDARFSLFWNVLDLRDEQVEPLKGNPRADQFVDGAADEKQLDGVRERILMLMRQGKGMVSKSVNAYLTTISSLILDAEFPLTIACLAARVKMGGVIAVIKLLREEIEKLDDAEHRAELLQLAQEIDPRDEDTQWVNLRWVDLCDAVQLNTRFCSEKTVDSYYLEGFLKKRPTTTLFGELASLAEKQDKTGRGDDPGRAKKCDYVVVMQKETHRKTFIYDELSAGENAGRVGLSAPHSEENFLDGMKVARAQYRTILADVNTKLTEGKAAKMLLNKLGIVYLQVIDLTVIFRVLVGVRKELFAIADVGTANMPETIEDVDKAIKTMESFLVYHNLTRSTRSTWQEARRVATLRGRTPPPPKKRLSLASAMSLDRPSVHPAKRTRIVSSHGDAAQDAAGPSLPLPPHTPAVKDARRR